MPVWSSILGKAMTSKELWSEVVTGDFLKASVASYLSNIRVKVWMSIGAIFKELDNSSTTITTPCRRHHHHHPPRISFSSELSKSGDRMEGPIDRRFLANAYVDIIMTHCNWKCVESRWSMMLFHVKWELIESAVCVCVCVLHFGLFEIFVELEVMLGSGEINLISQLLIL